MVWWQVMGPFLIQHRRLELDGLVAGYGSFFNPAHEA